MLTSGTPLRCCVLAGAPGRTPSLTGGTRFHARPLTVVSPPLNRRLRMTAANPAESHPSLPSTSMAFSTLSGSLSPITSPAA